MKTTRISGLVILAALFVVIVVQFQTNARLRNELALAKEEKARMQEEMPEAQKGETSAQDLAEGTKERGPETKEARMKDLESEVMRLRGAASRATRAETDVALLRAELEQKRAGDAAVAAADNNQAPNAMVAYLGDAVPPPANLEAAYTKEGLQNAIQEAARNAGVSLKKVVIETSEFPFLAGVVCQQEADFEKLKEQFKQMSAYQYGGAVSSHSSGAFNLVPPRAYPPDASERIRRRTMLREQMFFNQLAARQN